MVIDTGHPVIEHLGIGNMKLSTSPKPSRPVAAAD